MSRHDGSWRFDFGEGIWLEVVRGSSLTPQVERHRPQVRDSGEPRMTARKEGWKETQGRGGQLVTK